MAGEMKTRSWLFPVILLMATIASTEAGGAYNTSPTPPPLPPTDIREIRLDLSGCLGRCPSYYVIFRSDDSATYYGRFFVPRVGRYTGRTYFKSIAAWLDSEHIDRFTDSYALNWLDAPGAKITVVRKNRTKSITTSNMEFLPPAVVGIINALAGFAENVRWQPAGALESYLGTFIDNAEPEDLRVLEISPDLNESENRADGSMEIQTRDAKGNVLTKDIPLSVLKTPSGYVVMQDRPVNKVPCEMPCAVPEKDVHAKLGPETITIDVGYRRITFHRVMWWQAEAIEHEFKAAHRTEPSQWPSPSSSPSR